MAGSGGAVVSGGGEVKRRQRPSGGEQP
jgi:hypothetical protein